MAPRTVPAGDENDAAAKPAEGSPDVPKATPEAAETGGAKLIRTRHGDTFHYDPEGKKDALTGEWQEFSSTAAKAVIEAARVNGVRIAVADKKG